MALLQERTVGRDVPLLAEPLPDIQPQAGNGRLHVQSRQELRQADPPFRVHGQHLVGIRADDEVVPRREQPGRLVRNPVDASLVGPGHLALHPFAGEDMGLRAPVRQRLVQAVQEDVQVFLAQLGPVPGRPLPEVERVAAHHRYGRYPFHLRYWAV